MRGGTHKTSPPAKFSAENSRAALHNHALMPTRRNDAMSFLIRFAVCTVTVLALSVLAAMAWDGSDRAASAADAAKTSTP